MHSKCLSTAKCSLGKSIKFLVVDIVARKIASSENESFVEVEEKCTCSYDESVNSPSVVT